MGSSSELQPALSLDTSRVNAEFANRQRRRRGKSWKRVRTPRKLKTPKFKSFSSSKVSRKVRDLKELRDLKLVSSLSNGLKRLGGTKRGRRTSYSVRGNATANGRSTRLKPRFRRRQNSVNRKRRASSAVVLRFAELNNGERFRSTSDPVSVSEKDRDDDEESFHSLANLDYEVEDKRDNFEFKAYSSEDSIDTLDHGRLIRTLSGSGVYFARGFFEITVQKVKDDLGLQLEELQIRSEVPGGFATIVVITDLQESLLSVSGEPVPSGTVNRGDELVRVNGNLVSNKEEAYMLLKECDNAPVSLGIRHKSFFDSSFSDIRETLMSPVDSSFSDDHTENSPYLTDGADTQTGGFTAFLMDAYDALITSQPTDDATNEHVEPSIAATEELVLALLPDRVFELTKTCDPTYLMIQNDIGRMLNKRMEGKEWRLWFRNHLDGLCESQGYSILGMDMDHMSPVISRTSL